MAWTRTSSVACVMSQDLKCSNRPVTTSVLKITTPQNVIQSTDHTPVALPYRYACSDDPNGARHTSTARSRVTTDPIRTASHAVIRNTASRTSSSATGTSATSVVATRLLTGSSA